MTNKKPFNELSKAEQAARIAKNQARREKYGLTNALVRAVKPADIQDIAGGARQARLRVALWDKETNETEFFTGFIYLKPGSDAYEKYIASIEKGQLLSIDFKESNGYTNIYNIFDRSKADKARRAKTSK